MNPNPSLRSAITDLLHSKVFNREDLRNKKYENITFKNVSFTECVFKDTEFNNCEFSNCLFSGVAGLDVNDIAQEESYHLIFENCAFTNSALYFTGNMRAVIKMVDCIWNTVPSPKSENTYRTIGQLQSNVYTTEYVYKITSGCFKSYFENVTFSDGETGFIFEDTILKNVKFNNCNLNLFICGKTEINGLYLDRCHSSGSRIGTYGTVSNFHAKKSMLLKSIFSDCTVKDSTLSDCYLWRTNFQSTAKVESLMLVNCDVWGVDFTDFNASYIQGLPTCKSNDAIIVNRTTRLPIIKK
jgi:uncharacterized protein YjbI with pentapeptide repeats